jgi:hypothetical protein
MHWNDLAVRLIKRINLFFLFTIALFIGFRMLTLPDVVALFIKKYVDIVFLIQIGILVSELILFWLSWYRWVGINIERQHILRLGFKDTAFTLFP